MQLSDSALPGPFQRLADSVRALATDHVVLAVAAILAALALFDRGQAAASILFLGNALTDIAPVLALSVALAATIKASGAEVLVGRAFSGREGRAIFIAAAAGALSPLCSCGVVPLIAGLLAAGVPLAPVMAFWLSSPVMDPVMFVLTSGAIGIEFAIAKTVAALFIGAAGGWAVRAGHESGGRPGLHGGRRRDQHSGRDGGMGPGAPARVCALHRAGPGRRAGQRLPVRGLAGAGCLNLGLASGPSSLVCA
jgi:uncharacterized membrane protein YraQ (UPF0718 family)